MCVIIDANVAHRVLSTEEDPEFEPIQDALLGGKRGKALQMVYGGRLRREYDRLSAQRRLIVELDRSGRARLIPDAEVDAQEEVLSSAGVCESDDPHIIALAIISGARLLCSLDAALLRDFRDHRLVAKPRGKVYKTRKHRHLVAKTMRECEHCSACEC